ncbi:MAG: type II toxin-antitoxin system HicB family antitoxin [Thermaerobacter sp.]|nr:type II toxin-antitoxin system HicB family antitoxin [Thermaerobacter sp.]
MVRRFKVVLEPDHEAGGYVAKVPALPGCVTQGESIEEALTNAREAIELVLEDMAEQGSRLPEDDVVVAEVEVAV